MDKIIIKPVILDKVVLEKNKEGFYEEHLEYSDPSILTYNLDLFKPMKTKEELVRFGRIKGYKTSEIPRVYVYGENMSIIRKEKIPQDLIEKNEEVFVIEEIDIRVGYNPKEIKEIISKNIKSFAKSPLSNSKVKGVVLLIGEEDKEFFKKEDFEYLTKTDKGKTIIFKKF